ncbi:hypothetical protein LP414_27685 [Polaromonas sp. P1(28)-13]|nr:hypothetical protein LP414_27685 [Polaromonas sp. P1(28)-13]
MTIQVKISHGDAGHPASFYVSKQDADGCPLNEPAIPVKDGDTLTLYVHPGIKLVITERPPGEV